MRRCRNHDESATQTGTTYVASSTKVLRWTGMHELMVLPRHENWSPAATFSTCLLSEVPRNYNSPVERSEFDGPPDTTMCAQSRVCNRLAVEFGRVIRRSYAIRSALSMGCRSPGLANFMVLPNADNPCWAKTGVRLPAGVYRGDSEIRLASEGTDQKWCERHPIDLVETGSSSPVVRHWNQWTGRRLDSQTHRAKSHSRDHWWQHP